MAAHESDAPLATLHGVSKIYGEVEALRDLNLEVRRGEVLGLLGPNGAGKTTALSILCGIIDPTEGSAAVDGRDVRTEALEARRRFGFVPDGAPLYAGLSATQHLELVGRLHGIDEARLRSECERLLDALGLAERGDQPVGEFSRGMRQKAALACALLPEPPLLILDEPLAGLDAPTTAVIKAVLRAWADRGGAVVYSSHLLDVVERVCHRMAILQHGRLIALGTLDELRAKGSRDASLEEVFRKATGDEDPAVHARRVLGLDA